MSWGQMTRSAALISRVCKIATPVALSVLATAQTLAEQAVGFDPGRSALGQQYGKMEASYLSSVRPSVDL